MHSSDIELTFINVDKDGKWEKIKKKKKVARTLLPSYKFVKRKATKRR